MEGAEEEGWGRRTGGPRHASDGGLSEPSDGGPQTPLMGSRGHLGAASEVFDFSPGLSFPPLASLEGATALTISTSIYKNMIRAILFYLFYD